MHPSLLVTGATGLAGSNIALKAAERGWDVRALVREDTGLDVFHDSGIEVVTGDITDRASIDQAMQGRTHVVHAAAALGGTWGAVPPEVMWEVNHQGGLNVLDAAAQAGVERIAVLDTQALFDPAFTMTERSPLMHMTEHDSPYVAAKRALFYAALHRAAQGQHICFVTPGAIYGPGPFPDRALDPRTFTAVVRRAITGEITEYLKFPMYWIYVPDLAEISLRAVERGKSGHRYLAIGRNQDVSSMAEFCNEVAEYAGVKHRVADVDLNNPGDLDIGTMKQFAVRSYAQPYVDNSVTTAELGYELTPRAEAIRTTVDWLRREGKA